MGSVRLTKTIIDEAGKGLERDLFLWDVGKGAVSGFGLKVTPAGSKSFVLQYRMRGAASDRRIKIGKYGDWTLDLARVRARELRRDIDAGIDPFEKRSQEIKAKEDARRLAQDHSINVLADQFLEHYKEAPRDRGARQGRKRSANTISMVASALAFVKNKLGRERIESVTSIALRSALDGIPAAKTATRKNVDASLRIFFRWALERELIETNPFDKIKAPPAVAARKRVLSDDELTIIMRETRKLGFPFGAIFRLLALTGQRRSEVTTIDWRELDQSSREWAIPESKTKNGVAQIVHLSDAVVSEFDAIAPSKAWPKKGLVFTVTGKTPVSGHSSAKRRLDAECDKVSLVNGGDALEPWRLHDFRRTIATGLQRLNVRLEVTEAILNHISGSRGGITGVYLLHDWTPEKKDALDRWSRHVSDLTQPRDASQKCEVSA